MGKPERPPNRNSKPHLEKEARQLNLKLANTERSTALYSQMERVSELTFKELNTDRGIEILKRCLAQTQAQLDNTVLYNLRKLLNDPDGSRDFNLPIL
jgi:hypothetical protein